MNHFLCTFHITIFHLFAQIVIMYLYFLFLNKQKNVALNMTIEKQESALLIETAKRIAGQVK